MGEKVETRVRLSCAVDMQCMVSYVKWYRALNNGEIRTWDGLRSFRIKTDIVASFLSLLQAALF